jgi:hypothetical protein
MMIATFEFENGIVAAAVVRSCVESAALVLHLQS